MKLIQKKFKDLEEGDRFRWEDGSIELWYTKEEGGGQVGHVWVAIHDEAVVYVPDEKSAGLPGDR